ncbi:MAG: aldehyde ferredoxin oxidoreductase family protein [Deltaproteobacteria bacterium]|nr:MAG: aldehyde ferredoxin oxidoreductase family protein [Deltaproteobacteria bacterium]
MGNGYWQKLLRVDLTNKKTSVEPIAEEDLRRFIGGAGLAAEILRREVPAKIDSYDPKNLVIFGAGPFQGPPIAGGAKFSMTAISPVTGTFGDTAAGADWGPALKDAGYDMLVIEGASETPIYLHIVDDRVEIRDASNLTGMDTHETIDAIHKETEDKKLSIASIGPAGEKRVAIACIVVDKHSFAGRCGLGAVMGSKRLKAVAVRGTQTAEMSDPDKAKKLMGQYQKQILATVKKNEFRAHGTTALCESAEALGDMPIKYWEQDVWPEGAKKLGAPNYTKVLNAKPYPCKFCPIGCHRKIKITEPAEYVQEGIGPEYETLGMMGTNLLIDDPKAVAQGNNLASRLGLDTISAGAMVGFAMECFEKGWITDQDSDGLELKWGDPKALFALLEQIGNKEGFGAIFSEGTLGAAKKISPEAVEIVAHCKGLDFPSHDARSCISLAPTYATGTRGACHFRGGCEDVEMGGFFIPEIGIKEGMFKFFERENQSLLAAKCQDYFALLNSLVLCAFMVDGGDMPFSGVKDLFNAITGWDYSIEDLIEAGERIFTVQRLINIRDGYNAATDVMPKKMLQPAKEGFRAGKVPPFKELMEDYYNLRGWDENGEPSQGTLDRLGLAR